MATYKVIVLGDYAHLTSPSVIYENEEVERAITTFEDRMSKSEIRIVTMRGEGNTYNLWCVGEDSFTPSTCKDATCVAIYTSEKDRFYIDKCREYGLAFTLVDEHTSEHLAHHFSY